MQKAPDAFRTISEVAEELDVPQHVLRFWETRFSQIRPMKRAGGRRYYRPQDVDLLRGIRKLLYDDGYTIKGVQKILREHGIAHVIAIGRGELETAPAGVALSAVAATVTATAADAVAEAPSVMQQAAKAAQASVTVAREASAGEISRRELEQALAELEEARQLLLAALERADDASVAET